MVDRYKVAYEGGFAEIIEKKSRFIAHVLPIESEEQAHTFIESMKKQYWDAKHNCFAYVIGRNHEIRRCSDDGEPSGTAGKPILDVLLGEDVHNVIVVITRYFGGTLLGTGGLVKAYSRTTTLGLSNCTILNKCLGKKLYIKTDYNSIGKLQYIVREMELSILNIIYSDIVEAFILVPMEDKVAFEKKVVEATSAKAEVEEIEDQYFAKTENSEEVILF